MDYREVEVRFLEIDKDALVARLKELGAEDFGDFLLEEIIIYDKDFSWRDGGNKLLKLRTKGEKTMLTFKHRADATVGGTEEIEFEVSDSKAAETLLDRLGYTAYRHQQKKRHTFQLGEVTIDIDTWPRIPTYVELEGLSEEALKEAANTLGLDWTTVELRDPRMVIEEVYHVPVGNMRWFTFDKFE